MIPIDSTTVASAAMLDRAAAARREAERIQREEPYRVIAQAESRALTIGREAGRAAGRRRPDLSGEWADDETPNSLTRELFGENGLARLGLSIGGEAEVIDALCEEWERGVSQTYPVTA